MINKNHKLFQQQKTHIFLLQIFYHLNVGILCLTANKIQYKKKYIDVEPKVQRTNMINKHRKKNQNRQINYFHVTI